MDIQNRIVFAVELEFTVTSLKPTLQSQKILTSPSAYFFFARFFRAPPAAAPETNCLPFAPVPFAAANP